MVCASSLSVAEIPQQPALYPGCVQATPAHGGFKCDYERELGGCRLVLARMALGVRMPIIPWGRLASCPGCIQPTPAHGNLHAIMNAHWADALGWR